MEHILNVLKGIIIGIANAIPGVSGGTMMVITKVFDRIMDVIGNLSIKKILDNFLFLMFIGIGMVIGIFVSAKLLDKAFELFYIQTQFFFMGIVAGSLPAIYKEATSEEKFRPIHIIPFISGLAVIIVVTILSNMTMDHSVITEVTPASFIYMMVCLMIAAAAMIMPGLSGSLVMVILGAYQSIIAAIANLRERWGLVIPAAIGAIIGIILCGKAVNAALRKSKLGTYAVILGLIVGSFYAIFPRESSESGIAVTWTASSIIYGIIFLVLGAALPLAFDKLGSVITKKEGS